MNRKAIDDVCFVRRNADHIDPANIRDCLRCIAEMKANCRHTFGMKLLDGKTLVYHVDEAAEIAKPLTLAAFRRRLRQFLKSGDRFSAESPDGWESPVTKITLFHADKEELAPEDFAFGIHFDEGLGGYPDEEDDRHQTT